MITELEVVHFKGFARFRVRLSPMTVLVGPNNAGKSTLISLLSVGSQMLRYAARRKPEMQEDEGGTSRWVYPFEEDLFDLGLANRRHEFRPGDSFMRLEFVNPRLRLTATWREDGDHRFVLENPETGWQPTTPKQFKELGDLIGVVPTLAPAEPVEALLDPTYITRNIGGRLSSRHFRNQLHFMGARPDLLGGDFAEYQKRCETWASEITLEPPEVRAAEKGLELDLYYNEGRGPRELEWAGDGFQVWLQLLLHVQRLEGHATIVLDEPEVFLHPDLQRRLIHLFEGLGSQCILATHSPEIAAEVSDESLALVDRSREEAVRPPTDGSGSDSDLSLGTRVNFALAKSLRARVSLFVEGNDLSILRRLAKTCGAHRLATETGISVVRLGGIDNRARLEGFGWLADQLLGGALRGLVLLDRDYRMPDLLAEMEADLRKAGLNAHIWHRKELESYLLSISAMTRISGAPEDLIRNALEDATAELKPYVTAQYVAVRQKNREKSQHPSVAAQEAIAFVDHRWTQPEERLWMSPARRLLSSVNKALQDKGYKGFSRHRIADELVIEEIPAEAQGLIEMIEAKIS